MTETTIPTPPSKRPFTTDERALKVMPNGDVMHGLHRVATMRNVAFWQEPESFDFYRTLFEQALPMLDAIEELCNDDEEVSDDLVSKIREIMKAFGRDV